MLKILSLSLLALSLAHAADAAPVKAPKLPAAAVQVLKDCEDLVAANRAAYDAKNKTAFDGTEKMLKFLYDNAIKAGRKDEAALLDKAMVEFRRNILTHVDTVGNASATGEDLLGDLPAKNEAK